MRRLLLLTAGVLMGFLAGASVLVLALAAESLTVPAQAGLALFNVVALILASLQDGTAGDVVGAGVKAVWLGLVVTCLCPVLLVSLVGEAAGLRSLVWSAGATGVLTAAVPTVLRAVTARATSASAGAEEGRITLILFLTGVVAGFVVWAVAGRGNVAESTQP